VKLKLDTYYETRAGEKVYISGMQLAHPSGDFRNPTTGVGFVGEGTIEIPDPYPIAMGYLLTPELKFVLQTWKMNGRKFEDIETSYDLIKRIEE